MLHIEVRKKIVEARETGDISPKTHLRGRKPALDEAALLELKALINSCPDITLAEIKEKLKLSISVVSIHNAIHKKRHYTQVSGNARM